MGHTWAWAAGWTAWVRFQAEQIFLPLPTPRTVLGTPNLLSKGYSGQRSLNVRLVTDLHRLLSEFVEHSLHCPYMPKQSCAYRHSDNLFSSYVNVLLLLDQIQWVMDDSMLSGSCHHGTARPRVADRGDGLQIWRVAANILNKQSLTANSGWSSSLGVGWGANNPPP
jgi:hypothetical protein